MKKICLFLRNHRAATVALFCGVVLLIGIFRSGEKESSSSGKNGSSTDLSSYANALENELEQVLKSVDGVGKCRVMITFSDGGETVYAVDENLRSDGGSSEKITSDRSYVLISSRSDGLVLAVRSPSVCGVAVICSGGDSARVKNAVSDVVCRTLGISSDRVSVQKMSS